MLVIGAKVTEVDNSKKFGYAEVYKKIDKSKNGLLKYKKENDIKLDQLANENSDQDGVLVTVTFTKPLNESQVTKLVDDYQIKVDQLIGRAVEENGLRASFGVSPTPGSLVEGNAKVTISRKKYSS